MSVELLPCPCCGTGKSIVTLYQQDTNNYWVIGCGACGLHSGTHKDRDVVVNHWNTRTLDPRLEVAVEALEALEFVLDGRCFEGLDGLTKDIYEYQYEVHSERQADDGEDPNSEEQIEGLFRMIKDYKALAKIKGC